MSSYAEGKEFLEGWIRGRFPEGSTCLDVGACDGNWFNRLGNYLAMDAVEIWQPNIDRHRLETKYRRVFCADAAELAYEHYDLILFGDVIEHMTVEQAQRTIAYAKERCQEIIIAVPFLYRQGAMYGNPYEAHLQEDLTPERFDERYPGFRMIYRPKPNYAYYAYERRDDP
jgi:hypothetical protein